MAEWLVVRLINVPPARFLNIPEVDGDPLRKETAVWAENRWLREKITGCPPVTVRVSKMLKMLHPCSSPSHCCFFEALCLPPPARVS